MVYWKWAHTPAALFGLTEFSCSPPVPLVDSVENFL